MAINPQTDTNIDHRGNVMELQRYLRAIAYYDSRVPLVPVDGFYGERTAAAVEAYQSFYGLPVTGNVDETTWDSIYNAFQSIQTETSIPERIIGFSRTNPNLQPGDRGYPVFFLQTMLSELGDYFDNINDVDINGVYDEKTVNALAAIKKASLVTFQGVNKITWNNVTRLYNSTKA